MRALAIVRRDLLRMARNPVRTAMLFSMPLFLAGIFALVFGGGGAEKIRIPILLFDEDQSALSRFLAGAAARPEAGEMLEIIPVGEEGLEMIDRGEASALVHLPQGMTEDFLAGRPVTIEVIKNPSQAFLPKVVEEGVRIVAVGLSQISTLFRPELETIRSFTESRSFPPDTAVAALSGGINGRLRGLKRFLFPPVIGLERVTAGEDDGDETGQAGFVGILALMLPGLSVMGVLFLAQNATREIVLDRTSGRLRHLLTTPVTVGDYLAGKGLSVLVVTAGGFVVLIAIGRAAGVDWGSPPAVAALVTATSVAVSGTLLLIMSLVGTERQGDALSTVVIIVWSLIGGAFVPLSQIPDFLKPVSASTPVYWATDGFVAAISREAGLADIGLNLAVLMGVGVLFLGIGTAVLRRRIVRGV